MVSKKTTVSDASVVKTNVKTAEPKKKTAAKSKAAAPKNTAKKETTKQVVPETHNVDVIGEVLNVKSQNYDKKSSHTSKAVYVNS